MTAPPKAKPDFARGLNKLAAAKGKRPRGGARTHVSGRDLVRNVLRVVGFIFVAVLCYSPFGTRWINNPSPAWDTNRTAASWDTPGWSWDFVDCMYFATVTMTTVGYGDIHPRSRAEKTFACFMFLVSIVSFSACIGAITDLVRPGGGNHTTNAKNKLRCTR